ncbi:MULTISPECIES: hypothetical protein [Nostocales]|uniref:Uncharacterized protein n=3 Tax=Nostocales TaxID=1161 RepID=A0A0C1N490_9CYAN|nr:hypothetical protein [Tolypothrix bouteillei]KAF3889291.1 hypothetical protein DA73_0400030270 [Tolypothrix bouteillei VB521301]
MFPNPQDYLSVSPEYGEFLEEYYTFLKYSREVSQICVLIKTLNEEGNTQILSLLVQALQGHSSATKAYIHLIEMYRQMIQKYWNNIQC